MNDPQFAKETDLYADSKEAARAARELEAQEEEERRKFFRGEASGDAETADTNFQGQSPASYTGPVQNGYGPAAGTGNTQNQPPVKEQQYQQPPYTQQTIYVQQPAPEPPHGRKRKDKKRKEKDRKEKKTKTEVRYVYEDRGSNGGDNDGRKEKKHHPVRTFFLVLLIILLAAFVLLGYVYLRMHGSLNLKKSEIINNDTAMADYTNIALFGVDSTTESLDSGNNRSDINIILSINNDTKECKMVSVYRDTYLDIGDDTYTKCNAAYAYGGPTQAVAMLNRNFDLNITDYATVGFGGIADIIDAVGGVEIDVTSEEIEHLNNYQTTMCESLDKTYVPVTAPGTQTLNGIQATAYCRIRYTAGGDFQRTQRQRTVLTQVMNKLKAASPAQIVTIAQTMLGNREVVTSLSIPEITALAAAASDYTVVGTEGCPTESLRTGAMINKQDCIVPVDLKANVVWLHQYLFGTENYTVSDTVQTISDTIRSKTGL